MPRWTYQLWNYIVRAALKLPRKPPSWLDVPQMMRLTITTCNVLEMLGDWEIARPYNFLLLPMVDPVYGFAFHRRANEKVLLVCPFSSKQDQWFDLKCINVHNGKKYKMLDCKKAKGNLAYNVVFPSQFAHLLVQYQQHPEAKSLAPDGTPCAAETRGLLKRPHVIAGEIRYVGKETDRKWEEGDEISVLEFAATEYGRSGKVIASDEVKAAIQNIGINKCARESGFDRKNFIRQVVRGVPVKRSSYEEFVRWLLGYKSGMTSNVWSAGDRDQRLNSICIGHSQREAATTSKALCKVGGPGWLNLRSAMKSGLVEYASFLASGPLHSLTSLRITPIQRSLRIAR